MIVLRIYIDLDNFVWPWGLLLNVDKSSIPFSTEVSETSVSMPGVDGEIQVDNRYAAGMHNLVLWSWPDVTRDEKDMLYSQINEFLVQGKDTNQELHYERFEKTFYVRTVGTPERPTETAGLIEFSLPLKAHDPFGYKDNWFTARNVGEFINNQGNQKTPARIEFVGPCTNPSVTINGTVYGFTGSVPNGQILRADAKGYSVDFFNPITKTSTYENTKNWNGNFLTIPSLAKMEIQAISNAAGKHTTFWRSRWA